MTEVGEGEGGDVRRSTKVMGEIWHCRGYCEVYVCTCLHKYVRHL